MDMVADAAVRRRCEFHFFGLREHASRKKNGFPSLNGMIFIYDTLVETFVSRLAHPTPAKFQMSDGGTEYEVERPYTSP